MQKLSVIESARGRSSTMSRCLIAALVMLGEWWCTEIATVAAGWLPKAQQNLSAMSVFQQTNSLAFMLPLGLSIGVGIRSVQVQSISTFPYLHACGCMYLCNWASKLDNQWLGNLQRGLMDSPGTWQSDSLSSHRVQACMVTRAWSHVICREVLQRCPIAAMRTTQASATGTLHIALLQQTFDMWQTASCLIAS